MNPALSVPEGYKMTEVGVIPGDWEVVSIGEISTVSAGGTPSRAINEFWNGDIPWVTTTELSFDKVIETPQYISKSGLENSATKLVNPGAILIALYGQGKTRGKVALLEIQATTNQACAAIIVRSYNSNIFIYHFLKSQYQSIRGMSNSGSQENLSSGIIKSILIPLPPTKAEQQAIAEALSDADALVESLEQLLAKKRQIKQGAMQELLTGEKRLPGFSGEWEVKPMRLLGKTYGGLTGKSKVDFGHGSARYIPFMNVMSGTVIDPDWTEVVDVAPEESQNLTREGDLFFNGSSETPEEVGFCSLLMQEITDLYLNSFCFGFRFHSEVKTKINGLFFAYWFRSTAGRKAMALLAQGATRYNIAKSAFLKMEVHLPCEEEQTAIATILSDMDSDIAALQAQLVKARQIKQGMMQELLTGRIRLVPPATPGVPA